MKPKLPENVYNFYASGSDQDEYLRSVTVTSRWFRSFPPVETELAKLCQISIRPRVLIDVSSINTSTTLSGVNYHCQFANRFGSKRDTTVNWREWRTGRSQSSASSGLNVKLSSQSTTSLEDVSPGMRAGSSEPREGFAATPAWKQIYLRKHTRTG